LESRKFENEILVVSFGTCYPESIEASIEPIEKKFSDYFRDNYIIERAFTSPKIINIIKKREGIMINNVSDALENAIKNNIKNIVIQPTHIMNGFDYEKIIEAVHEYEHKFEKISIGVPLLTDEEDFRKVSKAIIKASEEYDNNKTAICFIGHGTKAASNEVYVRLQNVLNESGFENYYIGTVEETPTPKDIYFMIKDKPYNRVVLLPLMLVAGEHANNDIAGDEGYSWKSFFENSGYEVVCVKKGLGELPEIADIFIEHAIRAIDEGNR